MSINGIYATGVPAGHRTGKMSDNTSRKTRDFMRFAEKAAGAEDRTVVYAEKVSRRAFTEVTESTAAASKAETDAKAGQVGATEGTSLETMLKAKYPNLVYHVFDASSGYWRTRNDYPHYLLYQEGDKAKETLENWQPEGANPFYGSKNGKFIAPKEIHALGNVPPGSKAVVIHPKVQEKMEQDPAYAKEIMERIDTWFTFDALRNEAICPGITARMSQAVAIGEDGNICNAVSSSAGEITVSSDEMVRAYYLRMAKRAEFMRYLAAKQIEESIQESVRASDLAMQAAARSKLEEMMQNGRIREIFGDEIAGTPTETVLEITRAQIWGG